jgi:hypothetical protein
MTTGFRVVLDTNEILGAGSRWLESAEPQPLTFIQRLIYEIASRHQGLYCGKIAGEYIEKLIDIGHPPARVIKYLAYLMGAFERVEIVSATCNPPPEDEDDTIFLLCAIDGNADFLITEDNDLLRLVESYDPPRILCAAAAGLIFGCPC